MKLLKRFLFALLLLICCAVITLFYAVKIEPYRLQVKEYSLQEGKEEGEMLRIVQISDIQISESYTATELVTLVDKINELEPDLFFFTGDLYENYAEYGPEEEVVKALSQIDAVYGKYAIWGNRDYGGGCARHYEDILERSDITLLENSGEVIPLSGGKQIYVAGLDDYLLGEPDIAPVMEQLLAAEGGSQPVDYRILLLHEPDMADEYGEYGFDLMVAGHSHGGQVKLPFAKGFTTSMAEKYTGGFYSIGTEGTTKLYVNTGIGTSHYPVRFMVVPEITLFEYRIN